MIRELSKGEGPIIIYSTDLVVSNATKDEPQNLAHFLPVSPSLPKSVFDTLCFPTERRVNKIVLEIHQGNVTRLLFLN